MKAERIKTIKPSCYSKPQWHTFTVSLNYKRIETYNKVWNVTTDRHYAPLPLTINYCSSLLVDARTGRSRGAAAKSFVLARKTSTTLLPPVANGAQDECCCSIRSETFWPTPAGTEPVKCITMGAKVLATVAISAEKTVWKNDQSTCTSIRCSSHCQSWPLHRQVTAFRRYRVVLPSVCSVYSARHAVSRRATSIYRWNWSCISFSRTLHVPRSYAAKYSATTIATAQNFCRHDRILTEYFFGYSRYPTNKKST